MRALAWGVALAMVAVAPVRGDPGEAPRRHPLRTRAAEVLLGDLGDHTEKGCESGTRSWRAEFEPAFRPGAAVSLRLRKDGSGELTATWHPTLPGPRPTKTTTALLARDVTTRLVDTLDATDPFTLEDHRNGLARDGMGLDAFVCAADGTWHHFRADAADTSAPRHLAYFRALLESARETCPDEDGRDQLAQLLQRVAPDLPAKDFGGWPHRVLIYGALTNDHERTLAVFFREVGESAVLVDARDLRSVSPALRPVVVGFDRRRAHTVWVISRGLARELGLAMEHVVEDLDAGLKRLE